MNLWGKRIRADYQWGVLTFSGKAPNIGEFLRILLSRQRVRVCGINEENGVASEEQVLDALKSVMDPDLHRDIVSLGFVKDIAICEDAVKVTLELTTPACPVKDQLQAEAKEAILGIGGVNTANVTMEAQVRPMGHMSAGQIPGVRNIIPVGSGKGGVGKSTVSANVAAALAQTGAKVGLMDADVYGPSIPTILGITEAPKPGEKGITPVEAHGVKVISMGFFLKPDQAVVWRGPMLTKMIDQFVNGVEWGDIDYLIVDLPPGTGDIHLSLCQRIPLTGAVVVSPPQDVALKVAEKAIFMFRQLKSPILGLVENMSHFICPHCGEPIQIMVDPTGGSVQEYIEDCPVCCRPNALTIRFDRLGEATVDVAPG